MQFNENGTRDLILRQQDAAQVAATTGTEVQATQEEIVSTSAAAISTTITSRPMLSLGCPTGEQCGSSEPLTPRLDTGASAAEVLDAVQTIADAGGMIPGLGEPLDAVSALISLARGDNEGFALSAASMVPILGNAAGAKIGRRLANGIDGVKRGPSVDPNAPHNKRIREIASRVSDGEIIAGGGIKPEKLIPTLGGFKSGRRPDILVQRGDGSKYGINIGRQTRKGSPNKREAEAISDLEDAGYTMYFVPYN